MSDTPTTCPTCGQNCILHAPEADGETGCYSAAPCPTCKEMADSWMRYVMAEYADRTDKTLASYSAKAAEWSKLQALARRILEVEK